MPRANLRLDFRDLAAAALDSCGDSHSFCFDLVERSAIAIERCRSTLELLPTLNHDVDIFRIELDPTANAARQFRGRKRGAAAEKRLVHQLAALSVIQNRPTHQLNRFLC